MTTTITKPVRPPPPPSSNGSAPAGQRVGVGHQRRVSWVMLGLLLVAGASLAFLLVVSAAGDRASVVTAARDLKPGEVVKLSDLRSVSITADSSLKTMPASQAGDLVGRVPLAPLSAGTLLQPGLFSAASDVAAGETVVGASFKPGDVPGQNLRPGDHVALVQVASSNATDAGGSSVLTIGTVYTVDTTKEGNLVVSLRVPLDRGAAVANAAGQNRLRLLLVPADTSEDQLGGSAGPAGSTPPISPSTSTPIKERTR